MDTHRVEVTLNEDGVLTLNDLPFNAGDEVEVLIVARQSRSNGQKRYPLRGQAVRYDEPAAPVAREDWDALQ
jgi:hypothetical protein